MNSSDSLIKDDSFISDIVIQDYRTSNVFLRHNIDYCCNGKFTLRSVCEDKGLDLEQIKLQLRQSLRTINYSNTLDFNDWPIDFLIDYIEYVHHHYLRTNLSAVQEILDKIVISQQNTLPYLRELRDFFVGLVTDVIPHLDQEEKIVFPYIKQIAHAYQSRESYASLLVRTLRKPVENLMHHEDEKLAQYIHRFRKLTNQYNIPPNTGIAYRTCMNKLQELDNDLMQHIHLENNILFPKAIAMEQDLLGRKN
jgi:regulator of cell morphogenesis and NO signaling